MKKNLVVYTQLNFDKWLFIIHFCMESIYLEYWVKLEMHTNNQASRFNKRNLNCKNMA